MNRDVQPEILDALPSDDPRAVGSRRDLRHINRVMGHARLLRALLQDAFAQQPPARIVELGAGDGTLLLRLAHRLSPRWPGVQVTLVDEKNAVSDNSLREFAALGWRVETVTADVFDWLANTAPSADALIANLFLHHFPGPRLAQLLRLASQRARVIAACEPRRARFPLAFSRLVRLLGCNAVTRHDAAVSVRAGFAGREISALWPADGPWRLREQSAGCFSHAFLAERVPAP